MIKPVQTIVWRQNKPVNLDLIIQRATNAGITPDDEQFRQWAMLALVTGKSPKSVPDYALAIRIVDEEEARRFNLQYRGKDYATNVLSFSPDLPEGLPPGLKQAQLGDLLICAPVVRREAKEQGKSTTEHWAHLTIHGLLHLLGFDHEQPEDAEHMEALEISALATINIPDPYL